MTDAIVTFIAALLAVASAYVVSQRTISRSGSRLKMDLEILDLATRVGLSASEREVPGSFLAKPRRAQRGVVSQTFASWKQIGEWLGRVDGIRQAA